MEKPKRKYKSKDVEMILGIDIILKNAIADKVFLQAKRAIWTDDFFNDFQTRIDAAASKYLGADNAKQLRESTQKVLGITIPAKTVLSEIKVQIKEDFKKTPARRDELLNTLGFTAHYKDASLGDQEAMIQLLHKFQTNLTTEIRQELIMKGISEELIDDAISHSVKLKNADVAQEVSKGQRADLTAQAITELNEIYDDGIAIATISAKFHKANPAKKQQFSFTKVVSNMNRQPTQDNAA